MTQNFGPGVPRVLDSSMEPVCSKCGKPGEFRKGHRQCHACEKASVKRVAVPAARPWHELVGKNTDRAIAVQFGLSPASVCRYCKKLDIPKFRLEVVHG